MSDPFSRELLESMNNQLGELVRNVAEVRRSNSMLNTKFDRLEERIGGLEERIGGLEERIGGLEDRIGRLEERVGLVEAKVDESRDFLSGKIDHFIKVSTDEAARLRMQFEEERYLQKAQREKLQAQVDSIEKRLQKLEAKEAHAAT